jgi:hypothetical protein
MLILLALSLIAVFCYDRFLCPPKERWPWRHNLASTIISVVLGIATAIGIFQYQSRHQDVDRRDRLSLLLNQELDATQRDLEGPPSSGLTVGAEYLAVRPAIIQTLIIDDAIRSGLFGNTESKLLTAVSLAERAYNARLYHYLAFLVAGTGSETNAKNAVTNLEAQRKRVLLLIPEVKKHLKIPKDGNA